MIAGITSGSSLIKSANNTAIINDVNRIENYLKCSDDTCSTTTGSGLTSGSVSGKITINTCKTDYTKDSGKAVLSCNSNSKWEIDNKNTRGGFCNLYSECGSSSNGRITLTNQAIIIPISTDKNLI